MSSVTIRIVLVDDHMVVRTGLGHLLGAQEGLSVIGEAETGEEALLLCHKLSPDIVLMDIRMRGMGGIGATEAICRYHPEVRVIALSTFCDSQTVGQAMLAGAKGFLAKTVTADELVSTIRRVYAGDIVTTTETGEPVTPAPAPDVSALDKDTPLGTQQKRVLALMTKGYTNPEIATYLNISIPTARYHVSAILQKLGVSNRAEASAMAIRNNMVEDSDF